jgi:hypothetical protein
MLLTLPLGPLWQTQGSESRSLAEPIVARIFTCDEDRDHLFAARYRGFRDAGHDIQSPDGRYRDRYDDLPSTLLIGVYAGARPVGTMRVCTWHSETGGGVPCEEVYTEVAGIKAAAAGPVVELSRLAVEHGAVPMARRTAVYAQLVRMGLLVCFATDVDRTLVAAHAQWRTFYERIFGFRMVAGPEPYPPGNDPVILLHRSFRTGSKRSALRNPFFRITPHDIAELRHALGGAADIGRCR